ncbi:MAG: GntR family transcriptional regulator [Thermodesulfobacteriota bacterium]|nr:GntR family transcriptional regulator [Thermodesulfobacteriota bacterium]
MSSINSIRIFKEIEGDILSGRFKPRERLVEMDLISRFGVSRTVIREALKSLEARGLVRATPYRGVVVADLTTEEIEEIYFVRTELEKIAAKLVIKHITSKEIQELKRLSKEVARNLREKTHQMIEKDSEFHRMIFKACRNSYLYDMIDFLRTKAHIVRFNAWSLPHRVEQSIVEHREMIQAMEDRNPSQFEKLIVKHLTISKESYMSQLKGGDFRERAGSIYFQNNFKKRLRQKSVTK